MNVQSFPPVALALGYAGVIPFVALALSIVIGFDLDAVGVVNATDKLVGYGAVIISFIGAVHWGVAMQSESGNQNQLFVYSVVPALVAWVWLFFSAKIALFGMGLTIVAMLFADRSMLVGIVPRGYLKMRLHLSVVVAVSLLLAAVRL